MLAREILGEAAVAPKPSEAALDHLGVPHDLLARWGETPADPPGRPACPGPRRATCPPVGAGGVSAGAPCHVGEQMGHSRGLVFFKQKTAYEI